MTPAPAPAPEQERIPCKYVAGEFCDACKDETCVFFYHSLHTPTPVWTDTEVMKEIEDAFDRGIAAAEATIDMQQHDASIREDERERVLDELYKWSAESHGINPREARWFREKIESLRGGV